MTRGDERLVDGWHEGFGPAASRVLSVAAGLDVAHWGCILGQRVD